jgi:hypothetical protein
VSPLVVAVAVIAKIKAVVGVVDQESFARISR